jgi:hypothetical protein
VGATAREHTLAAMLAWRPIDIPKTLDKVTQWESWCALNIDHQFIR